MKELNHCCRKPNVAWPTYLIKYSHNWDLIINFAFTNLHHFYAQSQVCGLICEFSEPTNGARMKLKITVFHSRRNFIYYLNISTYVHIYGDLGRRGEGGDCSIATGFYYSLFGVEFTLKYAKRKCLQKAAKVRKSWQICKTPLFQTYTHKQKLAKFCIPFCLLSAKFRSLSFALSIYIYIYISFFLRTLSLSLCPYIHLSLSWAVALNRLL